MGWGIVLCLRTEKLDDLDGVLVLLPSSCGISHTEEKAEEAMNLDTTRGKLTLVIAAPCAFLVIALSSYYFIHGINVSRINSRPHATATIVDVWTEIKGNKPPVAVSVARIKFQRASGSELIDCDVTRQIGYPHDGFRPGDTVDVVPRLDSCYEPLVPNVVLN